MYAGSREIEVQLLARYEIQQAVLRGPLNGEPETRQLQLTARTHVSRYITFDPEFSRATTRTDRAQNEENLRAYRENPTGPVLSELRIYDEPTRTFQDIDPADPGPDHQHWGVKTTISASLNDLPPQLREAAEPVASRLTAARAAAARKEGLQ